MHFQENLKVEKFFRNLTFLLLLLISKTYKWALIVQYRKVEIENRNIIHMPISKSEVSLVLCVVWFSSQQNGLQLKIMIWKRKSMKITFDKRWVWCKQVHEIRSVLVSEALNWVEDCLLCSNQYLVLNKPFDKNKNLNVLSANDLLFMKILHLLDCLYVSRSLSFFFPAKILCWT